MVNVPFAVTVLQDYFDADVGPFGVGETQILGTPQGVFAAGKAYQVLVGFGITGTIGVSVSARIRRNNVAGPLLLGPFGIPDLVPQANWFQIVHFIANFTTADVTRALVLTCEPDAPSYTVVGSPQLPHYIRVFQVGNAVDFPEAAPIT